jgi:NAD(P)-dependent dehydrogenase (short-subunit alcohol dehydrogenase family)
MVVLVTGASRGIGRALAVAAAREGHDVVVNYLKNAAQANALVSELACCPCRVIADIGLVLSTAVLVGVLGTARRRSSVSDSTDEQH